MPSRFHNFPRGISFNQIEKCMPMKWRQSIKKPLDVHEKTKNQSFSAHKAFIELHENIDDCMVDKLVIVLKDFASRGLLSKAFGTFSLVQVHALASTSIDSVVESICSLLSSCTNFKFFLEGKQLHAQVITQGIQDNHALVSKLVTYYTTTGFLSDAHLIVANAPIRYPLPWNILISSYVGKDYNQEAILSFKKMVYKGVRPDNFTYPSIVKACAELSNLDLGRQIHKSIICGSENWNLFVQNALISMYGKCGDLETARIIFDRMPIKDQVSWNSIISGYVLSGKWHDAFELFESMRLAGVELNAIIWNTIAGGCLRTGNIRRALQLICQMRRSCNYLDHVAVIIGLGACSHICALKLGKEIHALAIRNSTSDYVNVRNSLITLYSRCGDLRHAYIVLRSTEAKTIITWNSIISGFAQWDLSEEVSHLFRELLLSGIRPNYVTLAGILPLCARVANLQHGREFHCYILRHQEFQGHLLLWNALIAMYARSGRVLLARRLFDMLDQKDVVTYTSIIAGYGARGDGNAAVQLFNEMISSQITPDQVAMIAVLSACSHSGLVAQGQLLFEKMQSFYGITPNLEHFACMADLYGRAGLLKKAKDIITRMPFEPTSEMWATLIGACRIHGNTDIGEWAAEKLLEMKPQNSGYYVLIANMYAAAGCWSKLAEVRTIMRDLGVRKDPGCAWVGVGAGFSPFVVDDTSNNQADEIYPLLRGLTRQMKDVDHSVSESSETEEEILFLCAEQ
ncbi:pentatricopeptide repeat-containing protein At1g71490-like isoform X1 [Andrographis paniculata]|uniref:pentatricopeptide repeat-containing protein At1g71490-like isoform X1 n=1 Tax=Andrographis paniculata TaxID=175694 RepID=UPI0021E70A3D|nr:pentatricopeptide repeat-containing protein At1g71490-like isoform X1 [Andrographis paniculata]XP_051124513.1 pentatricopeptide repeat-containing protein At1g71490-like isoform X1 [Andrographis paniculata]